MKEPHNMGMTIRQFPERDSGTGEYTHATEPVVTVADDVANRPDENAVDLPGEVTYEADDVDNKPAEETEEQEPVPATADWPNAENKIVKEADTKTADTKSARKPAAKRAAKRS